MPRTPPPLKDLKVAVSRLDAAYRAALLWSDLVRQDAEKRLGAGPTDVEVLDDPAYDRVLAWCAVLDDVRQRAKIAFDNPPEVDQ